MIPKPSIELSSLFRSKKSSAFYASVKSEMLTLRVAGVYGVRVKDICENDTNFRHMTFFLSFLSIFRNKIMNILVV